MSGGSGYLALHKGTAYFWLAPIASSNNIAVWGATGYTSGSAVTAQPNVSPNAQTCSFSTAGPYVGYHFFSTTGAAAYLHVAVEMTGGVYTHFCVGQSTTIGGASILYLAVEYIPQYATSYASYPKYGKFYLLYQVTPQRGKILLGSELMGLWLMVPSDGSLLTSGVLSLRVPLWPLTLTVRPG